MAKLNLQDIESGYALKEAYNSNNELIEAFAETVLSRDGETPNQMTASLDMNSGKVYNLADGVLDSDAVNVRQLSSSQLQGVSTEDAQFAKTYAAMQSLTTPSTNDVCFITGEDISGMFVFNSSASQTDQRGVRYTAYDATTGAWERVYDGFALASWFGCIGDGATEASSGFQDALDWMAVAAGPNMEGTLWFQAGEFPMAAGVEFDSSKITIQGAAGLRGTTFKPMGPMEYMIRHTRSGALSNSVALKDFRIEGDDIAVDRAIWLEDISYFSLSNIEVRYINGTGIFIANAEDSVGHQNFRVAHCGREVELGSVTVNMNVGERDVAISDSDSTLMDNDLILIPGAGAAGADLLTYIRSGADTTLLAVADLCGTTVSGVTPKRHQPSVIIGDMTINNGSIISNSFTLGHNTTVTRSKATGLFVHRGQAIRIKGGKFHGRTTNDEASPVATDLVVFDRCERMHLEGCQFTQVRRRAIIQKDSGGTGNFFTEVSGCDFKAPANYEVATDIAFVEIQDGMAIVDSCTFEDTLSHASYTTNGVDILLTGGSVQGENVHHGSPGGGFVTNSDDTKGTPTVGTPAAPQYVEQAITPTLLFGGGNTGQTLNSLGRAIKDGRRVDVWFKIAVTDKGSSTGDITIGGLPWAASSDSTSVLNKFPLFISSEANDYACKLTAGSQALDVVLVNGDSAASHTAITNADVITAHITYMTDYA